MPRHAAYMMMVVVVISLAAVDLMIITSSTGVTRIARMELDRVFGEQLQYDRLRASLDGVLSFDGMRLRPHGSASQMFKSEKAEFRLVESARGRYVESIILKDPLVFINQALIDKLSSVGEGPSLDDVMQPDRLPRLLCEGGTFHVSFENITRKAQPVQFGIRRLVMLPMGGYGYLLNGSLHHDVLGEWVIGGDVDISTGAVRLVVSTAELNLNDDVRALVADNVREAWDRWRPDGVVGVYIRLDSDGSRPLEITATVTPKDLSLTYEEFPYRMDHFQGEMDIRGDGFTIKHLRGRRNDTQFRFTGHGHGFEEKDGYTVHFQADNLPLDNTLRNAVKKNEERYFEMFRPSGTVDVRGSVIKPPGLGVKVKTPLELTFKDCEITYEGFPYTVRHAEGWMELKDGKVNVRGFRARDRGAEIRVEGTINDIDREADVDLRIEIRNLPLDRRLRKALGPDMRNLWADFAPEGVLDVIWRVRKKPEQEVAYHGLIHSRAETNKCTYRKVPVLMTGVRGLLEYTPEKIILHHFNGRAAGANVELHGEITDEEISLRIDAVGLDINESFVRATPGSVRKILERVRLRGNSNFGMDLKVRDDITEYTLNLILNNATFETALDFEDVQGMVMLSGYIEGEDSEILGHVNFARAKIYGKSVSDLLASLNMSDNKLRFGNLKASAYGGVVTGTFFVDLDSKDYGGEFAADQLSLREFVRETEDFRDKVIEGRVSFELKNFRGRGTDLGSIRGDGSLVIRDGFLWEVPLFVDIWTINPQKLFQKRNAFEAGNITFDMKNKRFRMREIAFSSEDVSVVGHGEISFDGGLDLVLSARSGSLLGIKIPGLDLILSPLDLLRSEFLGVRITGTFEEPDSAVQFFPGMTSTGGDK